MTQNEKEEGSEEKITYDWSPPSGRRQNFFYKGSPIDRDQVNEQ